MRPTPSRNTVSLCSGQCSIAARAVQMNILIIRVRELLASHKDLAARVEKLEANQKRHASVINILADEINQLKKLPEPSKRRIGF
jgi:hypothetical protein